MAAGKGRSQTGTPERQAELLRLMTGEEPDLYTAAKRLGIGVRTAARWWAGGLRERVSEARDAAHERGLSLLRAQTDEASRVLALCLRREAPAAEERLSERFPAAVKALELCLRLRDSDTRREDLMLKRAELDLKRQALKSGEDLLSRLVVGGWVCAPPEVE